MLTETDKKFLRRCVELAEQALVAGDEPFGSVLVASTGDVLHEARNRAVTGDPTCHPEFELARWAAINLSAAERTSATVYTSGEHCAMCAAAHGWAGLERIVYASSSEQLASWLRALGATSSRVKRYPIAAIIPGTEVDGPDPELAEQVRQLHYRRYRG